MKYLDYIFPVILPSSRVKSVKYKQSNYAKIILSKILREATNFQTVSIS